MSRPHTTERRAARTIGRVLALVVLVVAIGGGAFWAGRTTLTPPEVTAQVPDSFLEVTVVEQELGRVLTLTTTARRESAPLAVNVLTGVVTEVSPSGEHQAGDVLYRVGGTPVVLVPGSVPFWRDLGEGATGTDVEQLQAYLATTGAALTVDGTWGRATTAAVKAWQKSRGEVQSGALPLGTLVAAPALPTVLELDRDALWPGGELIGGETAILAPTGDPVFVMELNQNQADLVPPGTGVTVQADGATWAGVTTETRTVDTGVEVGVSALDGLLLCGAECGLLPATGETYLTTEVAVREPVFGPVVPVAAVTTQPDGSTTVSLVEAAGATRDVPVTVIMVADGLAAVDGVVAGEVVRVFGATSDSTTSPAPDPEPAATHEPTEP